MQAATPIFMKEIGGVSFKVAELSAVIHFAATPRAATYKLMTLVFNSQALENCSIGEVDAVPLCNKGVEAIVGKLI